jgi:glutathione S-transferase
MRIVKQMNPVSEVYFRRTHAPLFNHAPFEEVCPPGPKRQEALKALKAALDTVSDLLEKNFGEENAKFVMGDTVSWADFQLSGTLLLLKLGLEPTEWEKVANWNSGRWVKYMQALSEWEVVGPLQGGPEEMFKP